MFWQRGRGMNELDANPDVREVQLYNGRRPKESAEIFHETVARINQEIAVSIAGSVPPCGAPIYTCPSIGCKLGGLGTKDAGTCTCCGSRVICVGREAPIEPDARVGVFIASELPDPDDWRPWR